MQIYYINYIKNKFNKLLELYIQMWYNTIIKNK